MDSWKTDWDFLETIHRDLSSPFSSCGEQSGRVFHALDYHRALEILTFHTAEDEGEIEVDAR